MVRKKVFCHPGESCPELVSGSFQDLIIHCAVRVAALTCESARLRIASRGGGQGWCVGLKPVTLTVSSICNLLVVPGARQSRYATYFSLS